MIDNLIEVVHCEGWDPWTGSPVRPIPAEVAKERDRAGEHHATVLAAGALPVAMVEMAWQSRACTVWHFDEQRRRAAKAELRPQGRDELVLCEQVRWHYAGPRQPEFDAATTRHTQRYSAAGVVHDVMQPEGDAGPSWHRFGAISGGAPRWPAPAFADLPGWADLVRATASLPECEVDPERPGLGLSPLVAEPWQPPKPLEPGPLAAMFRAGARFEAAGEGGEVVIETRHVGALRMPTGRLVAVDVDGLARGEAFTVRVPPGTYPLEVSLLRPRSDPSRSVVAAGRLVTAAGPVTSWELALRATSDPRLLGSWGFIGFEITAGGVCLVDAAARQPLTRSIQPGRFAPVRRGEIVEIDEAEVGNLIAFPAEPGAYPTWIGRTADGQVACYLTDLLRLQDAQILS